MLTGSNCLGQLTQKQDCHTDCVYKTTWSVSDGDIIYLRCIGEADSTTDAGPYYVYTSAGGGMWFDTDPTKATPYRVSVDTAGSGYFTLQNASSAPQHAGKWLNCESGGGKNCWCKDDLSNKATSATALLALESKDMWAQQSICSCVNVPSRSAFMIKMGQDGVWTGDRYWGGGGQGWQVNHAHGSDTAGLWQYSTQVPS